jgi:hypothetical protein
MYIPHGSIFPKFDPVMVPIQADNVCLKLQLPERVYIKNGEFYTAEISDCEVRPSGLMVCLDDFSVEVEALKVKCLNGQGECVFEEVHCHPVIKQIRAGALIFSQETVWGLEVNETSKLVRVDQGIGKGTTKLYPWSKFTMIQTAQRIVYSLQPEDEVDPIFWSLVNVTTWNSQLRNRVLQIKRNNISRLLEESKETGIRIEKLGDDLQEMRGNVDSFNGFSVADICAFVAIGLWGVTLICEDLAGCVLLD